jgi:hypothetical protein
MCSLKNPNKKGDAIDSLPQNEISTTEVEKISPVAKYLSSTANMIQAGIASRYFVLSFGFFFWKKILKSLFVILKFLNAEPSSYI